MVVQVGEFVLSNETYDDCVSVLQRNSDLTVRTSGININSEEFWVDQNYVLLQESLAKFGGAKGVNFNGQEDHLSSMNRYTNILPPKVTNVHLREIERGAILTLMLTTWNMLMQSLLLGLYQLVSMLFGQWFVKIRGTEILFQWLQIIRREVELSVNTLLKDGKVGDTKTYNAANGLPEIAITVTEKSNEIIYEEIN